MLQVLWSPGSLTPGTHTGPQVNTGPRSAGSSSRTHCCSPLSNILGSENPTPNRPLKVRRALWTHPGPTLEPIAQSLLSATLGPCVPPAPGHLPSSSSRGEPPRPGCEPLPSSAGREAYADPGQSSRVKRGGAQGLRLGRRPPAEAVQRSRKAGGSEHLSRDQRTASTLAGKTARIFSVPSPALSTEPKATEAGEGGEHQIR